MSATAQAEILMSLTSGTHNIEVNDLATPGIVSFLGSIGNFNFSMEGGTGFPATGSPELALIDLSSLDLTSNAGGTLTIALTETDFAAKSKPNLFYSMMTGNFFNSQATLTSYLDTSNTAFGTGTLLADGLLDNASESYLEPPVAGPYSLTEIVTVTAGADSMASLDATVIDAPEPASLSLLGTALLALTAFGLRAQSRPVPVRRRG